MGQLERLDKQTDRQPYANFNIDGIRLNKQTQKTDATSLCQLLITSYFAFLSKKISSLYRS